MKEKVGWAKRKKVELEERSDNWRVCQMDTLPASNVVCRWPLGECSSNNLKNFDRCPNISVFCIIALNLINSVATGGGQSEEGSWAVAAVFRQV